MSNDAGQVRPANENWAVSEAQCKLLIELLMTQNGLLTRTLEDHKQTSIEQAEILMAQINALKAQIEALKAQSEMQIENLKAEMAATIGTQLANIQVPSGTSLSPTYAAMARTPPSSYPDNVRSFPSGSPSQSITTDTLYCTIDTSRVEEGNKRKAQPGVIREGVETMVRSHADKGQWRCIAVTKDPRNSDRIRVTCRTEEELHLVKETAKKVVVSGARVLNDQLYPIKIDNVNRFAVLNQDGTVRDGAAETFGQENNVQIAKISWLSNKETAKAYGSMVVYVTKGSDATRLLQEQYFNVEGESAFTRIFEQRNGPVQCYNCQAIGHKAFSCKKTQRCAKCAKEGHRHSECIEEIAKCVPCGGPHESFSRSCPALHPGHAKQNTAPPTARPPRAAQTAPSVQNTPVEC